MKNLKFVLTALLIGNLFYSCDNKEDYYKKDIELTNYSEIRLDTKNTIASFNESYFQNEIPKHFTSKEISSNKSSIPKNLKYKIALAPHYNAEERKFMLTFYQDLANSYDNEITSLIKLNRKTLNSIAFKEKFKQEVNLIFDVIEEASDKVNPIIHKENKNSLYLKSNGFWDCMSKEGKNVGRAIATGALVGAVSGAKAGAVGGTVSLPGIGTVTGAVGGAVFGAAAGAAGGAATALTWAAIDCLTEIKTIESFPEERLELSPDDIIFINSVLELPESEEIIFIQ